MTNQIADDLNRAMDPVWLQVTTDWRGRGGIRSRITVELGRHPHDAPPPRDDDFDDEDDDDSLPPGYR